jgi:intein/homing endonuclease
MVDRQDGTALTMREAGILAPQRPAMYVANGPAQLYRLITHSGRCIEATANRPFLTRTGWKPICELEPRDSVAVIAEYPELFGRGDTDQELLKLLAYLTRTGAIGDGAVPLIDDADILRDFEAAVDAKGDVYVEIFDNEGHDHLRVCGRNGAPSRVLAYLNLVGVHGVSGSDKLIPDFIFGLRKDKLRLFLKCLLTCDGAAERSGRVTYRTTSVRLARQLQHLFARFGIVAALVDPTPHSRGGARLAIDSKADVIRCIEQIGFLGDKGIHAEWLRASLYDVRDDVGRQARLGPICFDPVLSIEATQVADVYDLEIPRTRNFIANEFVNRNDSVCPY